MRIIGDAKYEVNLSEFAGQVAAIDARSWSKCENDMTIGCTYLLTVTRTELKRCCFRMVIHPSYVDQFMARVKMVQDKGVTPVLVFDGAATPIKKRTDEERLKYLCCLPVFA